MKNKKGFTLIELLAVIALISILIAIAYPRVMEIVEKKKGEVSEAKKKLIYSAAEQYIEKNKDDYPIRKGKTYCIPLETLVSENLVAVNVDEFEELGVKLTVTDSKTYSLMGIAKCIGAKGPTMTSAKEGETHKGIVYLDPTDLNKTCTKEIAKININKYGTPTAIKTGCMKWYIYNDSGDNYKMILDHNTTAVAMWNELNKNVAYEDSDVKPIVDLLVTKYKWKLTPRLISLDELTEATNYVEPGYEGAGIHTWHTVPWSELDDDEAKRSYNKYHWLFDYTYNCHRSYCKYEDNNEKYFTGSEETDEDIMAQYDEGANDTSGYWTSTPLGGPGNAVMVWYVSQMHAMGTGAAAVGDFGIRPVVTIEKSKVTKIS